MKNKLSIYLWLISLVLLVAPSAHCHPMDIGTLNIKIIENRIKVNLKLHVLAVKYFAKLNDLPLSNEDLTTNKSSLFNETLGLSSVTLGKFKCDWRIPEILFSQNSNSQFVEIEALAVCSQAKLIPFSLDFPLPFLNFAKSNFNLVTLVERENTKDHFIANLQHPGFQIGEQDNRSFGGFFRLGMSHIGVDLNEWRDGFGEFRLAEGLDHICFILALVASGLSMISLMKSITGFTLGHSITLGLSLFKVVHIHSRWIEILIAFSIVYIAASTCFKKKLRHPWWVSIIFGTIHGLGFATVLVDIDLQQNELMEALIGFNLGVEAGQITIIGFTLIPLIILKRHLPRIHAKIVKALAGALALVGLFWMIQRIVN